jgi:hypothetical protein
MKLIGTGVSKKPMPIEESYMPAFLSDFCIARSLCVVFKVTFYDLLSEHDIKIYFPDAVYSSDNAVGCAVFARRIMEK